MKECVRQREPSALIIFLLAFALDCRSGGWDRVMWWVFSLYVTVCSAYFQLMQKAGIERHEAGQTSYFSLPEYNCL